MKSLIILISVIILGLSICYLGINIKQASEYDRYSVVMNNTGNFIIKYDKYTGRTWIVYPINGQWVEIKDYGDFFPPTISSNSDKNP